jgi:RND family efflux transporter MFP subunit
MNAANLATVFRQHLRQMCARVRPSLVGALLGACGAVAAQGTAPTVQPLQAVAVYPQREVPAQVVARNQAKVAAQVGGVIAQWHADVGQRVPKGALLAQIDATDLTLALAQAQAQLNTAQAQLALAQNQQKRAQQLTAQGFYSQEALNQSQTQQQVALAQVNAAKAQRDLAQRQLSKTRITSPFAAEVTQRFAQTGETIAAGTALFVLSEVTAPELWAELSTEQAESLRRVGQAELIVGQRSSALPLKSLRISQSANATTRTHSLRLSLNSTSGPAPGSSAQLRWRERDAFVPADMVVRRSQGLGIFTVQAGQAVFHVLPHAQEGQPARVTLPASTAVVTQGQQRLQDGQSLNQ